MSSGTLQRRELFENLDGTRVRVKRHLELRMAGTCELGVFFGFREARQVLWGMPNSFSATRRDEVASG